MKFDWRAIAIAAVAAFLLSILVGIVAGVTFGALLFRAVLGALVFGAGAAGVSVLIDRFLPDLKSSTSGDAVPQPGDRVDIVVDDDAFGGQPDDLDLDDSATVGSEIDESPDAEFRPGLEVAEYSDESAEDDEDVETLESVDDAPADGASRDEGTADGASIGAGSNGGTAGTAGEPVQRRKRRSEEPPEDLEELAPEVGSASSLPDIEGLSQGFDNGPAQNEPAESSARSGEDPGIMARAIRTVLKREE